MSERQMVDINNATTKRKKVLNDDEYDEITNFIMKYDGLSMDCEMELLQKYNLEIDPNTIKSIVANEMMQRSRMKDLWLQITSAKILSEFDSDEEANSSNAVLLNYSVKYKVGPVALCRFLLNVKYPSQIKHSNYLKFPCTIPDPTLSANVYHCLINDNQDGPLSDSKRLLLGEEYELKLRSLVAKAGILYHTEGDLRRLGYDKTPDIKLRIPCLYKGTVINWIESKALFGDIKIHKNYIRTQFDSYSNRFGTGIVIYWFGYHMHITDLPENSNIIILDDFPSAEDLYVMDLNDKGELNSDNGIC